MPSVITSTKAVSESAYIINIAFKDEDGEAVAPSVATWSLCDKDGTIINSREGVAISSPSTTEDIILSGDDLATPGTRYETYRYLVVEFTYTSDLGALSGRDQVRFSILDTKC